MATSGSLNTSAYEGRYLQLAWSRQSYDIASNPATSTIAWELRGAGSASSSWYYAGPFTVVIDGQTVYQSSSRLQLYDGTLVASGTLTIAHAADGTRSFDASVSAAIYKSSPNVSGSGSWVLDQLPRATAPTLSASTIDMGQTLTISCPAASPAFRHNLSYVVGVTTVPMATGVESSYAWPVPIGLADKAPSATSLVVAVVCDTYSGSTLIGSKYVYATLTVPASVVPTITDFSLTRINTVDYLVSKGIYVAGYSKVGAHISAAGAYGSTITRATVSVDGKTYNGSDITSDMLQTAGTLSVVANITDSRGRTAAATRTITVQPYARPTISSLTYKRGTYSGGVWTASDTGADVKITFTLGLSLTAYSNAASLSVAVAGETTQTSSGQSAGSKTYYFTSIGVDVTRKLTVTATDSVGTAATTSADIPTIKVLANVNVDLNSLRFGGVAEDADTFRCSLAAKFDKPVTLPSGLLADYVVTTDTGARWRVKKWASGDIDIYSIGAIDLTPQNPALWAGSMYYFTAAPLDLPVALADANYTAAITPSTAKLFMVCGIAKSTTTITIYGARMSNATSAVYADVVVHGRAAT